MNQIINEQLLEIIEDLESLRATAIVENNADVEFTARKVGLELQWLYHEVNKYETAS